VHEDIGLGDHAPEALKILLTAQVCECGPLAEAGIDDDVRRVGNENREPNVVNL
jgi:hypothetical protein